ncbi:MAG: 5,10-methylenetetrahydrofolate reductase [Microbacteriaceae bacterium]|nr:5,10-methylenetetrahydrofolate reductase [Microbacteriaceae bacterium]
MTAARPRDDPKPARFPFSFEVYPPRNADLVASVHETIHQLAAAQPDFIAVTYGAGGSSRDQSLELVRYIAEHTTVPPMAHLTCVGSSAEEANRLVREFLDAGIRQFLAIRGDAPEGARDGEDYLGDLRSATELVQLIHRVQLEREPYTEVDEPQWGGTAVRLSQRREPVRIGVAAFPNGHPQSRNRAQDIDVLLAKQAQGANLAITQLFFDADDYVNFVTDARAAGVEFPITPGIMPVTSLARLKRIVELTDEPMPAELAGQLEEAFAQEKAARDAGGVPEITQYSVGVAHAVALGRAVLEGGAPGIHLYAFNQHRPVLDVLRGLGAIDE